MRRTRLFIIACMVILLVAFLGGMTFAWIGDNGMTSPIGITAHLHKSYFESGDGSAEITYDEQGHVVDEGPFEIKYPIQLYYLAWLQKLGYFNADEDNDGTVDQQFHFYLSDDLDMSEDNFVLPPIGTQENPFIGEFDGQGHIISNLTIANNNSNVTDPPEGGDLSQVEIIGLFGVVGSLPSDTYVYDSSINEVKDLYIANVNVKTSNTNALIGIAAGYVNATVSGVGVINSSIEFTSSHTALTYTENLSDYSLIGYCTDAYKDNVNAERIELGDITTATSEFTEGDDGTGAGGSIAMKSIYTRVQNMLKARTTVNNYPKARTEKYDQNGNLFDIETTTATYYRYNGGANGNQIFMSTETQFTYMGGGTRVIKEVYTKTQTGTGFYISDGTNYLTLDGSNLSNTTNVNLASAWQINNNNRIYTKDTDGTSYYLRYNNSTLTVTTTANSGTQFTKTTNQIYYDYSDYYGDTTRYYLIYDGGWKLTSNTTYSKYAISISTSTNYYLITDGTSLTTTSTLNDAYIWMLSATNGNRTISVDVDGTTYYLTISTTSPYDLSLSETSLTWRVNNNRLSYRVRRSGSYNYYYYYFTISNDGAINTARATSEPTYTATFTPKQFNYDLTLNLGNAPIYSYTFKSSSTTMDFSNTDYSSYIPLKASESSPFTLNGSNTGYIVSAHEISEYGDIRISQYSKSDISSNRTDPLTVTFKQSTPTAVTASNATSLGLQKFNDSYNDYRSLVDQNDIYGLHFMNASISKDKYVTIPSATIINEPYTNFQVPSDSIDFVLKQRGFINFYAGTFYSGNTAFFSFHQIFRNDDNTISDIKEIKNIYGVLKNGQIDVYEEYVYEYKDGSFSGGYTSVPSNYQKVFEMSWLTAPTGFVNNAGYYFEVPANEGEYAIGSVDGANGAYLLYLDLQANKQVVERTAVTEVWKDEKTVSEVPNGVAFVETKGNTIDEIKSATVTLPAGSTGKTVISRTGDAITYTDTTGAKAAYIGNGITANGESGGSDTVSILTERITYYDYNKSTKQTRITVTTTTITTNADGTTTRTSTQTIDGATNSSYVDDNHAVTMTNTIAKWYYYDRTDATITTTIGYDYKTAPTVYNITIASDKDLTVTGQTLNNSYTVKINNTALTSTETDYSVSGNGD